MLWRFCQVLVDIYVGLCDFLRDLWGFCDAGFLTFLRVRDIITPKITRPGDIKINTYCK